MKKGEQTPTKTTQVLILVLAVTSFVTLGEYKPLKCPFSHLIQCSLIGVEEKSKGLNPQDYSRIK